MMKIDAQPRAICGTVRAERPGRIALPVRTDVSAYSKPEAFNKWNAGVRAAAAGENVITIYDVIGEDWWTGEGVTVNRIDAALRKVGQNNAVEVHINSPGGDVFEGIAIFNRLREHGAKVTVKVMGLAASAASIIAMAGDEILIGASSFLMIHDCWVVAVGNRHDMAETAAFLEPFDAALAEVYASRSGQPVADCAAWMDAEKWINGSEAIRLGFADGLLPADEMAEDDTVTEQARATNAMRQAEHGLMAAGSSRTQARELLAKIKGKPGAAPENAKRDAGGHSSAAIASLIETLRS
jgi:ATP-dependent Clp protease protease subunit